MRYTKITAVNMLFHPSKTECSSTILFLPQNSSLSKACELRFILLKYPIQYGLYCTFHYNKLNKNNGSASISFFQFLGVFGIYSIQIFLASHFFAFCSALFIIYFCSSLSRYISPFFLSHFLHSDECGALSLSLSNSLEIAINDSYFLFLFMFLFIF